MAQLMPENLIGELEQVAQQVGRGQVIQDMVTTRLRKGGVAFPANITYAPVSGNDDRVLAYSALVHDMTEKQDLQERLVYSQKREALGRLVPPLFHEVSNRLTPVLLESRLIAESAMDPDQPSRQGAW
jgi:nitrogen-specific signal transduction histidine kinase